MPPFDIFAAAVSPCNGIRSILSLAVFNSIVHRRHPTPTVLLPRYRMLLLNNLSQTSLICALPKKQLYEALQEENLQNCGGSLWQPSNSNGSSVDENSSLQLNSFSGSLSETSNSLELIPKEEYERRRKIGLANKGKTPWNKGRKHSAETRARIKLRTVEALRDPKVRKKMSECPRAHTAQSKARIGLAQRRVWGERLKLKRFKERCYSIWAQSIAEEARRASSDQQELDWSSYERIKAEIFQQQQQWQAEKGKAEEMAKLRAEQAAKARADKIEKLAQLRKERDEKKKARAELKAKVRKELQEQRQKLAILKRLQLKARLTKNKPIALPDAGERKVANPPQLVIEEWDPESIKKEKMRREVSLAELIQAAKNRKTENTVNDAEPREI
ncbi:hypothetical protein H6P81_012220 [Aristolochia fimbriata]|uniref:Nuclease associated modular domain-containing protein n=1 Tax=Aristolochia fimbriata TaxID=158543 RepID=A0AAV7EB67_ARIFI|nr:hypothetical protein H6P81_012220 [Aristolochia fimbriata]